MGLDCFLGWCAYRDSGCFYPPADVKISWGFLLKHGRLIWYHNTDDLSGNVWIFYQSAERTEISYFQAQSCDLGFVSCTKVFGI
jgi:hypothetical protein